MLTKKQRTGIIVVACLVVIVPIVWYVISSRTQQQILEREQPLVGVDRVDPVSGETITESTRNHESDKGIAVLGATQLFEKGFGMNQYAQLEAAFSTLTSLYTEPITLISFYKDSAGTEMIDGEWVYVAKAQINEKFDHIFIVKYTTLSSITLEVYDAERKEMLYSVIGV